ncbi:MAG: ferredoxin [Firmicutes bacterium]|nr:ferredoxin [Bacillota bacterium]
MIANYGYMDGSGEFFITVDTGKCVSCSGKPCVAACPGSVLEIIEDDGGDEVIAVKEEHRKKIKYSCASCKPAGRRKELPCAAACKDGGIRHSW